jgi:hypothetical protein
LALQIGDVVDPGTKARRSWVNDLLTEFCIWLLLSLLVTVEQIDENNKAQHVCSPFPAFHSYYISSSGGRRIKRMANSVMVATLSNHRARGSPAIILIALM